MPEIIRNRTIRPSTRKDSSANYRVHIDGLSNNDTLIVNISHETKDFNKTFVFKASDVLKRKSLGFKVSENEHGIVINWISTQPIEKRK